MSLRSLRLKNRTLTAENAESVAEDAKVKPLPPDKFSTLDSHLFNPYPVKLLLKCLRNSRPFFVFVSTS